MVLYFTPLCIISTFLPFIDTAFVYENLTFLTLCGIYDG
jgi:hypothetical protein